jgi:hypothetical protein
MDINIKLDSTSAENYATFHGWTVDSGISIEDFVTSKILDKISNDLLEQANRNAIAGVVPVADVTVDKKQTALKEQAQAIATAKLEAMQVKEAPVEEVIKGVK